MVDTGELNIREDEIKLEFERVGKSFNTVCKYILS
jgi:hypothetical protein